MPERLARRLAVRELLGSHRAQADADGIFQDTWLEVTRAKSYRPGSFPAFVRTVATRKALDHLASLSVRKAAAEGRGGNSCSRRFPKPRPAPS